MNIHDKAFIITLDDSTKCLVIAQNFSQAEKLYYNEIQGILPIKCIERMTEIAYVAYPPSITDTDYSLGYDSGIAHVVNDILPDIGIKGEFNAKELGNAIIEWENQHILQDTTVKLGKLEDIEIDD